MTLILLFGHGEESLHPEDSPNSLKRTNEMKLDIEVHQSSPSLKSPKINCILTNMPWVTAITALSETPR